MKHHMQAEFGFTADTFNLISDRAQADAPAPAAATTTPEPIEDMPLVYAYTRRQALADGEQIDAGSTAKECGFTYPVYITRAVWDAYVTVPRGVVCQDEIGRLCDILTMLRYSIKIYGPNTPRITFKVYVRNNNRAPKLIELVSVCGPTDIDDARPSITIMLPNED